MATTTTPAAIARTVSLRKKLVKIHTTRRLKKSLDYLREDVARHAKADISAVRISADLNNYIVSKTSRNMNALHITVSREGGLVKADLAQELKRKVTAQQLKPGAKPTAAKKEEPAKPEKGVQQKPQKKQGAEDSAKGKAPAADKGIQDSSSTKVK